MNTIGMGMMAAGLLAGTAFLLRVPRLPVTGAPAGPPGELADVAAIIPVRNEAPRITGLLDDLERQTVRPARIVVVDDGSTDGTAAVVVAWATAQCRSRLDLLAARPSPPGWNPKSWALHEAVGSTTAARLWFLDADVRLGPDALASVAALHDAVGGLVSVAPRHDAPRWAEALSFPCNAVALMGAGAGALLPGADITARSRARAAFGPCLLIARTAYHALGGHQADAADLLDDVALARRARAAGTPVSVATGGDLVRYRMYPDGLRAVWEGWAKNIAAGAARTPAAVVVAVGLWVAALVWPLVALAGARTGEALVTAAVVWTAVSAHTTLLARRCGRFPLVATACAPVLGAAFVAIVAHSAYALAWRRPVRWKGRLLTSQRSGG